MESISIYIAQVVDGVAYGSIYGMFALSLVILYRANKLFNFAQTEIATLGVMICLVLLKKLPPGFAVVLTLVIGFLGGAIIHMGLMRFITERKTVLHSSEAVMTIGLFTVFNSINTYLFGDEPQPFPSPFGDGVWMFHGVGVSYLSVGILCSSMVMVSIIFALFKFTRMGLLFEAVAENIIAARLRGIYASNFLALAWGLTILVSVFGGSLIAPILYVTPAMLGSIFAYSLIAVVVGGLESPLGALVGGIIVGVIENLSSNISFIGTELKFVAVVVLLLVVLVTRPRGIWGRAEARRV